MIWLNIGLSWKITKVRIPPLFVKLDLCSATSMESSRRDLLNDMTEHRSILKNYQNTYHPRFGFKPKTGIAVPNRGFVLKIHCVFLFNRHNLFFCCCKLITICFKRCCNIFVGRITDRIFSCPLNSVLVSLKCARKRNSVHDKCRQTATGTQQEGRKTTESKTPRHRTPYWKGIKRHYGKLARGCTCTPTEHSPLQASLVSEDTIIKSKQNGQNRSTYFIRQGYLRNICKSR